MKGELQPLTTAEMAMIEADARRCTAALVRRMAYELRRTRQMVRELDDTWGDYNRIAGVDNGDYATFAWEHFTEDVSDLTSMIYEWEWSERGTWDRAR